METIVKVRRFKWSREFTKLTKTMAKKCDQNNKTLKVGSMGKSEIKEVVRFF